MEIYDLKEKKEYLDEVARLEYEEWADNKEENKEERIKRKKEKICNMFEDKYFCKLILIEEDKLIGFISFFPNDCDEEKDLKPWYATMYVKKEYRGKGYSKILNDALLKHTKELGYNKIYLKSELINYYEKFGAKYIENLNNGEKLYYIDLC